MGLITIITSVILGMACVYYNIDNWIVSAGVVIMFFIGIIDWLRNLD